jgi:hypothetical protein
MNNLHIKIKAQRIWDSLDDSQKTGIRRGMFPLEVEQDIAAESDDFHEVMTALMDCADGET